MSPFTIYLLIYQSSDYKNMGLKLFIRRFGLLDIGDGWLKGKGF
jgi:hypothetical protein